MLRIILLALLSALPCVAEDLYIGQSSAGAGDGSNCSNQLPYTFFNSSGNWGAGAGKISAGDTVHVCGAVTTQLSIQSAGTSVSKITIKAETGASVKVSGASSCPINANNFSHLIFDGGGSGILAVTGNGTSLATQVSASAFCGVTSWGDIEVKNWELGPFYIHSSLSDVTVDESQVNVFFASALSGDVSIHDNRIHDCGDCILIDGTISGTPAVAIYNNTFVDYNWALGWAPASGGASSLDFHNNDLGPTAAWDTTADQYHHNGIHFFAGIGTAMTASNIFNNYFHGDWGNCCTTNFIFTEFTPINHQNVYNNLFIQHDGNLFPLVNISATNSGSDPGIANNTFVCGGGSSTNTNAIEIGASGTVVSGVNFENNVVVNCNTLFQELAGVTQAIVDYNAYMVKGAGGNGTWGDASGGFDPPLSGWQAHCGCDAHSNYYASSTVNSDGSLQSGSPARNSGVNLSSFSVAPLNISTSAGGTQIPITRPSSGPWDAGAYQAVPASTSSFYSGALKGFRK